MAIIISYPTSASGIIVLFKKIYINIVFNFEQTRTVTKFGEHILMAKLP